MTNIGSIRKSEEKIFKVWRTRILNEEDSNRFVPDGVVDPIQFFATSPRIVLLLKEVYDDPSEPNWESWKLYDYLFVGQQNPRTFMWDVAARWISAIFYGNKEWSHQHPNKPFMKLEKTNHGFRGEMLRKIAVVNVKKNGGGRETKFTELRKHSISYGSLAYDQIAAYRPNLIISGVNNRPMLKRIFGDTMEPWESTSTFTFCKITALNSILIDANHPSARGNREARHKHLVAAVKEAMGK